MTQDSVGGLKSNSRFWKRLALPVLNGPIAGMWWSPTRGTLGTLLGKHESAQLAIVRGTIAPGDKVLDIGAGYGFFTLLFSRLVGKSGRVTAVEPDQGRAEILQHHIAINRLPQAEVLTSSVSGDPQVRHRYADTTLEGLVESLPEVPTHIRIAIGRDELATLESARETLKQHRPVLFLATHGQENHHRCCKMLVEVGYQVRPLVGNNVSKAPQLVCTPVGTPRPKKKKQIQAA